MLHLGHDFVRCRNLDTSESRSELPGKFWSVVLEKAGEEHLDTLCKKLISIAKNQGGEEYPTNWCTGLVAFCIETVLFYITHYWKEG